MTDASPTEPRVLVLDNDAALRELLRMALQRAGLAVVVAATAEACEPLLREGRADLLLLDLNLAGGDCGWRRVQEWSAADCLPPFFAVTGTPDDPRCEQMAGSEQFLGVIAKPFPVLELGDVLRRRYSEWVTECGAHALRAPEEAAPPSWGEQAAGEST
jgi:DNA-binding response OmpR family regulator